MTLGIPRNPLATAAVAALLLTTAVAPAQLQKAAEPPAAPKQDVVPAPNVTHTTEVKVVVPAKGAEAVYAKKKVELLKAVVRPARVVQPVPPAPPAAVNKAQKDAITENMLGQMRPILRAELHLIRHACKTSKDDQAKLAKEGERVLRDVAGTAAEIQLKMQQGIGVPSIPSAVEEIQKALATAVKADLSPAQAARYQAEVDARTKSERDVAARCLVTRFDPVLNLTPDQRAKIAAALAKSDNPMARSLDNLMYQNNYLPAVPDNDVVPYLDDRQKALWRDTQRVHFGTSFNYGINGINLQPTDLAEEDDPAVAADQNRKRIERNINGFVNGILRGAVAAPAAPAPVLRLRQAVPAKAVVK